MYVGLKYVQETWLWETMLQVQQTDPACDNEREEFGERDAPPLKKAIEKTPTVPGELSFLYKNKESQRH